MSPWPCDGRPAGAGGVPGRRPYNDTHGHQTGDLLLREAAAAWMERLRKTDVLARYGGEEFIVLLPGTNLQLACEIMERVRPATPGAQTFSCGVATWDTTETSEELIARADAALYEAKNSGRDRIVAAAAVGGEKPLWSGRPIGRIL